MALTTLANVKLYLGITDSSKDTLLTEIITNVSDMIETALGRDFDRDTYSFNAYGTDDNIVTLPNLPINAILYAAYGDGDVITVEYTGSYVATIQVKDAEVIVTVNLVQTSVPMTDSDTLQDVATAISAIADFTATVCEGYENYPAKALWNQAISPFELNESIYLKAPTSYIKLNADEADGVFFADVCLGRKTQYKVIYDGGYTSVPGGLEQIAKMMIMDAYRMLALDGNLQSEKIGDYSYTMAKVSDLFQRYSSQLNHYRRAV